MGARLLPLVFLLAWPLWAITIPPDLALHTDSVFNNQDDKKQQTFVRVLEDRSRIYYAATFKTVPFPLPLLRAKLENVPEYGKTATFVKKGRRIPHGTSKFGTYLIVVGVAFAKSWFLCDIDSVVAHGNEYWMFIDQNHDEKLNDEIRKQEDGIFTVEYEQFKIYWRLKDLGNGSTRVAMISCVDPKIWIPDWLFRIVSKVVYPGVLADFEAYVRRSEEQTAR